MTNDNTNLENELSLNIKTIPKKTINVDTFKQEKKKVEQISDDITAKIADLKQIRVNNTLSAFDKKKLIEIKAKIENISALLIDPEYSLAAGLVLDGTLKAASDNYLIFVYESENVAFDFNMKVLEIEKMLLKLNIKMKVVAVNNEEWNVIKSEFNSKTKEYKYEEDTSLISELFKKNIENTEKNSIESMFDDIIKYN